MTGLNNVLPLNGVRPLDTMITNRIRLKITLISPFVCIDERLVLVN